MSYISASLSNIDGLMQTFHNALTSSGWSYLNLNTSSLSASSTTSNIYATRETIYKANGASSDPTSFYLSICRTKNGNGIERVVFTPFTGIKNFATPVTASSVKRFQNSVMQITCSAAHNLTVGDRYIINGLDATDMNLMWAPLAAETNPSLDCIVTSVPSATTFTSLSVLSTGNTGSDGLVVGVYNPIPSRSGASSGQVVGSLGIALTDAPHGLFLYYDQYRIAGMITQAGVFQNFIIGETARDHIPSDFRGRAFISASLGTGSVTVNLDRQISLTNNQFVCFIHPSGTAGTGSFERVQITLINSSSFSCNLSNTYTSGTLIGEDALPVVACAGLNTTSFPTTQTVANRTTRFIFNVDGTRNQSDGTAQTMTAIVNTAFTEANIDPDSGGYYQGQDVFFQRASAPEGIRGRVVGFVAFPIGTQNDQDIMRVGSHAIADDYKVFVSNTIDGTYAIGIGPGAT